MQRVTNLELFKLDHWNPAKDMRTMLVAVKDFIHEWARLEVDSDMNNMYVSLAPASPSFPISLV